MSTAEDAAWLRWVTERFQSIAGQDEEISLEEFKAALQVQETFFAERFFALFDVDGSGTISLGELHSALRLLLHGTAADKLRFLFQVYDVDGSGSIDVAELLLVLQACLRESKISLPPQRLHDMARVLLEAADKDGNGSITFQELQQQLEAFPGLMESLTISAASWLKPPAPTRQSQRPHCLTSWYWHNHRGQLAFLGGYISFNLLLFILAALQHVGRSGWVAVARGCGQCLNFNCVFIAVPMLRRCLTRLRATPTGRALPLEHCVALHQLVGSAVLALAVLHTGAHVANFGRLACNGHGALSEFLLMARPDGGGLGGTAPQTGLALQVLLFAMVAFSSPCVRRGGHFELFYWSHLSYIFVWALLFFHAPNFWKWFLVPGGLFVLEKVVGTAVSRAMGLRIVEVHLLPSQVTHLVIQRPRSFHYEPGDYIYLNIPAIAAYEWHPFSISSAPEQQDTIWLHIRSLGQWTTRLYEFFRQPEPLQLHGNLERKSWWQRVQVTPCTNSGTSGGSVPSTGDAAIELTSYRHSGAPTTTQGTEDGDRDWDTSLQAVSAGLGEGQQLCSIKCYIDGPYGTPTRRIFTSEHAVLIGAGIGITPFASILQSIMYRYRQRKQSCPGCETLRDEDMALRKVDFIWINRDQQHFEWFLELLAALELQQEEQEPGGRFLELHLYMTSALGRSDVKAVGLQLALDLLAAKEQKDSITGLRTRTQPGHPDWSQVLGRVAEERKGKVNVFFCGSPALAKVVRAHCERFSFRFFKENF
ncbi:NADPH oxidase 5 isoform X2 [Excalfactoria chinensis]|uniref:NADPH oxidase 5 isoform X2 n=1 Tax=Excalfactoria chinensis TaxID=46218 RepID=UPI003B3B9308